MDPLNRPSFNPPAIPEFSTLVKEAPKETKIAAAIILALSVVLTGVAFGLNGDLPYKIVPLALAGASVIYLAYRIGKDSGDWVATCYNRFRLAVVPKLATPFIILGLAGIILGCLGLILALTGAQAGALSFIAKHIPASVIVSLIMIRAGIHSLNNGVQQARRVARWRQEAVITYMMAWLEFHKNGKSDKYKALMYNVVNYQYSLPEDWRLDNLKGLGENALHGKALGDLWQNQLSKPVESSGWDKWYNFWLETQHALGTVNVVLAQLLLATAVCALVFLCMGPNRLPAVLESLVKDPYLSLSFSILLFVYWLDSTKRGLRMRGLAEREEKRAHLERDMQLLALGIIKGTQYIDKEIHNTHIPFDRDLLDGIKPDAGNETKVKWKVLTGPLLFAGTIITILGILYLIQSLTNALPPHFDFLGKNATLFAVTMITTGFFALYQGIGLMDKGIKKRWKTVNHHTRSELLHLIFRKENKITPRPVDPLAAPRRISVLTGIAPIGYVLGIFVALSGVIGIFAAAGLPVSSALSFITKDPSFSAFFCLSMVGFGADAISNADRTRSYQARKKEDYDLLTFIQELAGVLPSPPPPPAQGYDGKTD